MPGPESETITDQESASAFPVTRTRPPAGVYFTAFETRLPKICWQSVASVTTTVSAESARASQSSWRAEATGANWRSISAIRAPIVNEPRADRSRALDDSRVVEISAGEAQAGRRRGRPS